MTMPKAAAPAANSNEKTTALTVRQQKLATVRDLFEKSKSQIKLALPKHVNPDRLLRVAMTSIQRTPDLLECDRISLLAAVMQAAQLGLEPDGVLGHAYLIPFNDKKAGKKLVQFIPGYRGLIDLARRSGHLSTIYAEVVHEKDEFEYEMGLHPRLVHRPTEDDQPGALRYAYAVAKLKDGGEQFAVMSRRQVMAIKAKSAGASSGKSPWNGGENDEAEMWKKTALRRLFKVLPVSIEVATATALHDQAETGLPQTFDIGIDLNGENKPIDAEFTEPGEKKETLDDLAREPGAEG